MASNFLSLGHRVCGPSKQNAGRKKNREKLKPAHAVLWADRHNTPAPARSTKGHGVRGNVPAGKRISLYPLDFHARDGRTTEGSAW